MTAPTTEQIARAQARVALAKLSGKRLAPEVIARANSKAASSPASAPTPEQMRALAAETEMYLPKPSAEVMQRNIVTLRVAAYQLEAVRSWLDGQDSAEWGTVDLDALDAILTADTAPQEDRDE